MTDREPLVARMVQAMCRRMWGCSPEVVAALVRQRGSASALLWFAVNMPRYLMTVRVLGALRTHLACVVLSLHNGCAYCAHGHAHAVELLHLRDTGRMFPLDAATLASWEGLPPRRLAQRLRAVLAEAGLHAETLWVDQVLDIATGAAQPVDHEERRLAHLVGMVAVMNAAARGCTIVPDEAMDPVNKDVAVKARYAAARALVAEG
jgi:hypothetical protein